MVLNVTKISQKMEKGNWLRKLQNEKKKLCYDYKKIF